jgi:S-DNA-T family DNA segregation ATPase FtsK/SpoIIIE
VFGKNKKSKKSKNTKREDFNPQGADDLKGPKWELNKKFFMDPKTQKVIGFVFLVVSIYFTVAFISTFFNWKADQSIIEAGDVPIVSGEGTRGVSNNMGYAGAWIGNFFVFHGFGLAALFIPFMLFLKGVELLFGKKLIQESYLYVKLGLLALGLCMLTGIVFYYTESQVMAGGIGISAFVMLKGIIGVIGYVLLLLVYFVVTLTLIFDIEKWVPSLGFIKTAFNLKKRNHVDEQPKGEVIIEPIRTENKETIAQEKPKTNDDLLDFTVKTTEEEHIEPKKEAIVDFSNTLTESEKKPKKNKLPNADEVDLVIEEVKQESDEPPIGKIEKQGLDTEYDPTLDLSGYKFPSTDLLKQYEPQDTAVDRGDLEQSKNMIVETLKNYKIGISSIKANIGPTVTLYEIIPAPGVKISKIKNLEDDIALSLAALGIRIIAPIPGKGAIGIEVPNKNPQLVSMHSVITSAAFQNTDYALPVCLGKTISNEVYVADMAKMPHLLMAGATGQGKSVGLNALLISLLYKKHPSTIKFVLVDPKKVELTLFNKIERHYLAKLPGDGDAIITDNKKVIHTLNSLCIEMDERYNLLQSAMVRNIKDYNKKFKQRKLNPNDGHQFLPYIIVVIDEVADLIMTAGKEVEQPIGRLAQLARAIGIHLVLATQRPSVNIITGTIKANFPARIAFRVTSKIDSRTILDGNGADQLIGRGDMLYSTGSDMLRLQCPFVDTPEVEEICDFIGSQRGYPSAFILPEYKDEEASGAGDFSMADRDALFEDAARLLVGAQQGSTSLIQRKMKIGYNRAGRIIDQLEAAGIVGPFEGSKAREVLIPDEYALELFLKNLEEGV